MRKLTTMWRGSFLFRLVTTPDRLLRRRRRRSPSPLTELPETKAENARGKVFLVRGFGHWN